MLTALVAISLFSQPTAIDFDHPGAPVSRAVEAMGKAYRVEMTADPTMKSDFVILALRSETVERARELLAKALNATWTEKEGKWTLHRTAAQEREDDERDIEGMVKRIQAAQSTVKVPPRVTGKVADAYVQKLLEHAALGTDSITRELVAGTPMSRAVARLRKELDARVIAKLPRSGGSVFGNRDTLAVRRLPARAVQIIREAIQDQIALSSLISARAATIPDYWQLSAPKLDLDDTFVTIYPMDWSYMVELSVPVRDANGHLDVNDISTVSEATAPVHEWPKSLEAELSLSALSKEAGLLRQPRFDPSITPTVPTSELLDVFLDHRRHDALELSMSDVALQAARAEGVSYVVGPLDGFTNFGTRLSLKPVWTLKEAMSTLFSPYLYDVARQEGCVFVRPLSPAEERRNMIDRERFASALNVFLKRSARVISPLAESVEGLSPQATSLVMSRISLLSRVHFIDRYSSGTELLLLFAGLTQGQKLAAAGSGFVFEPRQIGPSGFEMLRGLLAKKVNNSSAGYFGIAGNTEWTHDMEIAGRKSASLATATSRFVLRHVTAPRLYQATETNGRVGNTWPITPESVAQLQKYAADDPEFELSTMKFRAVQQESLTLSLLDGDAEVSIAVYDAPPFYEGERLESLDKMPAWVRERYAAEIKRIGNIPPRSAKQPLARSVRMH